MKKTFITLFSALLIGCFLYAPSAFADNETQIPDIQPLPVSADGAINAEALQSFSRKSIPQDKINAVSSSNLNTLAEDREVLSRKNSYYSNTLKAGKIQDQKKSGRCWNFSVLNTIRVRIAKKYGIENFELSQNYLLFWDKMEKANYFLELIIGSANEKLYQRELKYFIQHPVDDGGHWHFATDLIQKYGIVPKCEMGETVNSENTSVMNQVLNSLMRKDAQILRHMLADGKSVAEVRAKKVEMLGDVYSILTMCLGTPPKSFNIRYENKDKKVVTLSKVTPLEFYKSLDLNLDDYVALINIPFFEYNKTYEVGNMKNIVESKSLVMLNVDIPAMKNAVKASIKAGEVVYFAADVLRDTDRVTGVMSKDLYNYSNLLGINIDTSKKDRILYFDSMACHAMVFTGFDVVDGNTIKWQVENSWGEKTGDKGFYTMYDQWFDENVFQIFVNKKYLTDQERKDFEQTPTVIPEFEALKVQ